MSDRLDDIDTAILRLLQRDGRIKRNRIAEEVGLSVPAVSERMRKLEARGVITGYHAVLDAKRLHVDITAYIRLQLEGSSYYDEVIARVQAADEILEMHSITGEGSHILKVRTRNTTTLERLLSAIQRWPGVRGTQTSVVLSSYKESTYLPVAPTTLDSADDA